MKREVKGTATLKMLGNTGLQLSVIPVVLRLPRITLHLLTLGTPHLTSVIDGSIAGREASFISTGSALGSLLITDGIITTSVACTSNMAEQVPIYPLYLQ
jgi:hypothetical protein